MQTTDHGWQVLDEETATLMYTYRYAGGATANAFATRMDDGRLAIVSPPTGTDDGIFDDLADFGEVGALVVPNGFHHLGQPEWRRRFPDALAFAAPEAAARVAKKNADAGAFEPIAKLQPLLGDRVFLREVPNTRWGETWAWVKTGRGHIWFASDVLANMPALPKPLPLRLLFKWSGSAPGYRVFGLATRVMLKDRRGALRLLAEDVELAPPSIMVPGHGRVLDDETVADRTREIVCRH